ncbi:CotY/CotZ family spore coat protein [Halobacillus sp. H74]|uniref:CotY/CotZ family spore coat protein n=1 Tax=Halobacillus sp. H74 TaxID=3457436 RepID=UPI003FCC93E9
MSCKCKKSNCVCEKVRKIAAAQDEVANNDCCRAGSCEKSLRDLLSPAANGNGNDTIPFMLLCGCESALSGLLPYFAWGVRNVNTSCFGPIPSPFFRVKKIKEDDKCCAVLELLYPSLCDETPDSLLDFIEYDGWFATGACVEVDLSNFTGITCFPPTTTMTPTASNMQAGINAVNALRNQQAK